MSKSSLSVLVLLAFALAAAPTASAKSIAPYDPTYGVDGTLRLRSNATRVDQAVNRCEQVSGGAMAIAGVFGEGQFANKGARFATALVPGFSHPRSKTSSARWHAQRIPAGEQVVSIDFGSDGSLAYATAVRRGGKSTQVRLFRALRDGRADRRFGGDGEVVYSFSGPPQATSLSAPRVTALRDGGVLLSINQADGPKLIRFSRSGRESTRWGSEWNFQVTPGAEIKTFAPVMKGGIALEAADGDLIVSAGDAAEPLASRRTGLLKLTSGGAIDSSFGTGGLWLPPLPAGPAQTDPLVPYSPPGQTLMARLDTAGRIAVLYADLANFETGVSFDYHLATVGADGQTVFSTPKVGSFFNGGDDGFPSSYPMGIAGTPDGVVFATGETYYGPYAGTFRGFATRWRAGATTANAYKAISTQSSFAADDFSPTPDGRYIYACGSNGRTSSKAKPPWQRKRVAIRRIKL